MVLEQVRSNTTVILAWFTFCPYFCTTYLETFGLKFHLKVSFSRSQFEKALAMFTIHEIKNAICTFHLFFCRKVCFSKAEIYVETRIEITENKTIISFRRSIEHFCRFDFKKKRSPSAGLTFQGSLKVAPVFEKDATMTSPGFNSKTFDIFQSNFLTQLSSAKS